MPSRFSAILAWAFVTIALSFQASAQSVTAINDREARKQQEFSAYRELCLMKKDFTASFCVRAVQPLVEASNASVMIGDSQMPEVVDDLLAIGCALDDGRSCMWMLHPSVRASYSSSELVGSFRKGVSLLGQECQQGAAPKCRYFAEGLWWFSEVGTLPEQLQKAMPVALKRSCDLGGKPGCLALAKALADGTHGFPQNEEAASSLRARLCKQKYYAACDGTANVPSNGKQVDYGQLVYDVAELQEDVIGDENASLIGYLEACAFDYAKGCEAAGAMLFQGEHVSRDRSLGFKLFEKSCELGKTLDGCIAAGLALKSDDGVPQTDVQTAEYYIKAYERECESSETKRLKLAACRGFK